MKNIQVVCLLALVLGGMVGCKKADSDYTQQIISSCTSPPAPVVMILLDKKGNNLVKTAADKVVISYKEAGQTITIPCTFGSLEDASTRQPTAKYPGLAVGCEFGSYSIRETKPAKTFQIMVNDQAAGTVYYDLQPNTARTSTGVQDCFKLISFQLNTRAVPTDETVRPFVAVLNCDL